MKFNIKKSILVFILMITTILLVACEENTALNIMQDDSLKVHFIDVGQGDSELIQLPNKEIVLIDGGPRSSGDKVVEYIKSLDISKIDYLIATHPHEDHIGGLPKVIENFDIGKIYMPNKTASTKIFETLLDTIDKKGLKITEAKAGVDILKQSNLELTTLAPNAGDYSSINDYSIVNKLVYKNISIIFTGDAEKISESEIVSSGLDISADILKVGHHGSVTSTTEDFLDKVNPKYAIISSAEGNDYGHPHKETVQKLTERNINILRTDQLGTIVLSTDGNSVKRLSEAEDISGVQSDSVKSERKYIGNKNTNIYHDSSCSKLPAENNRVYFESTKQAEEQGYQGHSSCIK